MASFIYPPAILDILTGGLDFSRDDFAVMLLDPSHSHHSADSIRADLSAEVSGGNYREGGLSVDVRIEVVDGETSVVLGGAAWPRSNIVAQYAAYYRKTGNEYADTLVALIDFGRPVQSANDLFSLTDTIIQIPT